MTHKIKKCLRGHRRLPRSQEEKFVGTRDEPDDYFKAEPRIANALHEEEGLVGVGLSFVQGPGWSIERRTHGYVPDDGDSHVRVRFQAERHDGDDDEEDWDDADDLKDSDKM